jgi:hypothetical protein
VFVAKERNQAASLSNCGIGHYLTKEVIPLIPQAGVIAPTERYLTIVDQGLLGRRFFALTIVANLHFTHRGVPLDLSFDQIEQLFIVHQEKSYGLNIDVALLAGLGLLGLACVARRYRQRRSRRPGLA